MEFNIQFSLPSFSIFQTKEGRREIMECRCDNDDYHQDITPIVLAGQRNDFSCVKVTNRICVCLCQIDLLS